MQVILLSGGSGTRLWPLSNDARSKQFLKLLDVDGTDRRESMVQRVLRQLGESGIDADVTVATGASQRDSVIAQLGDRVDVVTEPCRRDTFPAICLACEHLARVKGRRADEVVVVMPCDPYAELGYFETIRRMAEGVAAGVADMVVMGIAPTYPSSKYGYVLPDGIPGDGVVPVRRFTEKPDVPAAERLIAAGALWNGGVFAFRLGYLTAISGRYVAAGSFSEVRDRYCEFPKISFDYEVAEKAANVGMVRYRGQWKDLGTWNTLTDELRKREYGNVITDGTGENTHVFNELSIPLLCLGTRDLVIAASPDGILVTEKGRSEGIKEYARRLKSRPMYEERRWGTYKVIDSVEFADGNCALTRQLTLNPGCAISYQRHALRDEAWTFIDGEGEIALDGERRPVRRGDVIVIPKGQLHALRATTRLSFIEVQTGSRLVEEDVERLDYDWE